MVLCVFCALALLHVFSAFACIMTFFMVYVYFSPVALYRGCFDGFVEVEQLTHGYDRCRNQTWNGKTLPWCMCDEDLCNGDSMNMGDFYNIDAYSYDGNTDDHRYNTITF